MERIDILGQSGHSSDPSLGRNALDAMRQPPAQTAPRLGLRLRVLLQFIAIIVLVAAAFWWRRGGA